MIFYGILGHISTVAVAAGNIVMRMASLAIMPTIGVGVAVQTLVSRCLGANDARGAWRTGLAGVVLAAALMAAHYDPRYAKSRGRVTAGPVARVQAAGLAETDLPEVAAQVAGAIERI